MEASHAHNGSGRARRLLERLLLGSVMTLIATVVDRRLRRVFRTG